MKKETNDRDETLTAHQLFLRIRLSARYHQQRQKVLLRRSRIINLLNIILSLGVVAALLDHLPFCWKMIIPASIATLSAADTVFGFTSSAYLHESLYRRFKAIEAEFIGSKDPDLQKIHAAIIFTEADEPPENRSAVNVCDNEIRRAAGHDETHNIGRLDYLRSAI